MKMEHVVTAPVGGIVRALHVSAGDTVYEGDALLVLEESAVEPAAAEQAGQTDLAHVRPDLAEVQRRHALTLDAARPDAVGRRRATGQRTARENVDDLCDPGSFVEYGPLVVAAQRRRRSVEELIERTPADGLVGGVGRVDGHPTIAMSYDYTVLAGTQGLQNHRKKDRLFELAERQRLPIVFFTEGGGGRPGDTDGAAVSASSGPRRSARWTCRCPTAWWTSRWTTRRRRCGSPGSTSPTSAARTTTGRVATRRPCATWFPTTAFASTTCGPPSTRWPT